MIYEERVMEKYMDYCVARTHLVLRLSNYDDWKKHLAQVPFRRVADLALTCHFVEKDEKGRIGFTVVDQGVLDWMEVTEEQLFSDAFTFGPQNLPPVVCSLEEMLEEVFEGKRIEGFGRSLEEQMDAFDFRNEPSVLTNSGSIYGASAVLYPNVLERIGKRMGGNFFILPSSVHETILLPDDGSYRVSELKEMVWEINRTELMAEEWLSDTVYYYDKIMHAFGPASEMKRK